VERFDTTGIPEGYDASDGPRALHSLPQRKSRRDRSIPLRRLAFAHARERDQWHAWSLPAPDDQDSLAALRNLLDNFASKGGEALPGSISSPCREWRRPTTGAIS